MSTVAATDLRQAVEDAAAHLYVWALKDIPQDLRDALAEAKDKETSVPGRRVLETIVQNVEVAETEDNIVCQDTGIAVYTCRVGEHFPLHPAKIYEALKIGTERATVDTPLRSNAVHTITRENTGPNTGHRLPIVHWEFIPDWDGLDVKCIPKGSGSENMSFLKMCVPADGVKGIKQFVLESIVGAGGKPCPPGIVGVGIGGSADYAMYLAKEAIARPVGTTNPDPDVAKLERELFELLNETGVGPMGLGGDVTVLVLPRRARRHAHDPQPGRRQLSVLGRATRERTRDRERRRGVRQRVLMAEHRLTFPTTEEEVRKLRAGDLVTVDGHIIGIRDRTQIRIFDEGVEPPLDLNGAFLLHTAPNVRKLGPGKYEPMCVGTTTSARMVRFTEPLGRDHGVRAIAGKGGLPDEAIEPMAKHGMVYFALVGGAAALETTQIEEIEEVFWEELMPECLWKFRVKDFGPLWVGIDAQGNSMYHDVQTEATKRLEEIVAGL